MVTRAQWRDAVKASDLKMAPRLVALVFADFWPRTGPAVLWADEPRLTAECGMSRATLYRAMDVLRDAGWLEQIEARRQHRSPRYRPHLPGAQTSQIETSQRSQSETQTSQFETQRSQIETRDHRRPEETTPLPPSRSQRRRGHDAGTAEGDQHQPHCHEPNVRRSLAALGALPLTADEILAALYRIGRGDPWTGYLTAKPDLTRSLDGATDRAATLRARLRKLTGSAA